MSRVVMVIQDPLMPSPRFIAESLNLVIVPDLKFIGLLLSMLFMFIAKGYQILLLHPCNQVKASDFYSLYESIVLNKDIFAHRSKISILKYMHSLCYFNNEYNCLRCQKLARKCIKLWKVKWDYFFSSFIRRMFLQNSASITCGLVLVLH